MPRGPIPLLLAAALLTVLTGCRVGIGAGTSFGAGTGFATSFTLDPETGEVEPGVTATVVVTN